MEMEREAAKHGLTVVTAALFLAGEMAGSGVLALPNAMVGTGESPELFSFASIYKTSIQVINTVTTKLIVRVIDLILNTLWPAQPKVDDT